MSCPPPPGLKSSTPNPPASLPARPPPSAVNPAPTFKSTSNGPKPAFTAFAPRSVASANTYRTSSPAHYSAPPVTSYNSTPQYPQALPEPYQAPPQFDTYSATPQIRNPFITNVDNISASASYDAPANYDPEYEAQIQQWQSAYAAKDGDKARPPGVSAIAAAAASTSGPRPDTSSPTTNDSNKTVQRSGGGANWTDQSLLEWDAAHFRIFVGNLAGEVTDESLLKAFSKYPSVQKARVIRDKRTTKSRGYGFVSFSDGDDYFQAAREMQGKYIGSHPVLLKRSTTEVKASTVQDKHKSKNWKNKGKGGRDGGRDGGQGKVEHGGVNKGAKGPKTKGGMKVLGHLD